MEIVNKDGQEPAAVPQQVNINLADQPNVKCEECQGIYFESALSFKKVSKLLTGAPQDQIAPVQLFLCKQCGTPNKELLPEGM